MRKKNFKLKVLEEGRLGNGDLSEIYGGDVSKPCDNRYISICTPTTFNQPCFSYTTCSGSLPDGNPSFLYCIETHYIACTNYRDICNYKW